MLWTIKDGRKILISDMSDAHLVNLYKMLISRAAAHLEALEIEAVLNEMSAAAQGWYVPIYESPTPDRFLSDAVPQWSSIKQEIKNRELAI